MVQVWMIMLFGSVLIRAGGGLHQGAVPWERGAFFLGGMTIIAVGVAVVVRGCRSRIERRGGYGGVLLADRAVAIGRLLAVLWHLVGVFAIDWVEVVRSATGDLVLVDELLAVLPAVLVITSGWWSFSAIERAVRSSTLVGTLDQDLPVYPEQSRVSYVVGHVRHQILLALAPVCLALGWAEAVEFAQRDVVARGWLDPERAEVTGTVAHVLGLLVIFVSAPLLIRHLWSTIPLGAGVLRDRLLEICRSQGVKARALLVWRTHGTMANGAVLGFTRHFRYILLTDALLDRLRERQVEAVMAHEVAHVRLRHIPWMLAAVAVGVAAGSAVLFGSWTLLGRPIPATPANWWSRWFDVSAAVREAQTEAQTGEIIAIVGSIIGALLVIGPVSRRFEWQADAFSVKLLSREDLDVPAARITAEAAHAMIGALDEVARFNHVPRERRSWRHGSVLERQKRLAELVHSPADRLPIDRTVAWTKRALSIGMLGVLAAVAWG